MLLVFGLLSYFEREPSISALDPPKFKPIDDREETDWLSDKFWEERFDQDHTIATGLKNTSRSKMEYILCSINVRATFESCWAFGTGPGTSAGGAMFFTFCQVNVHYKTKNVDSFVSNMAAVGGAISFLYSRCLMENAIFKHNRAYRWAGAVWFQGYERGSHLCAFYLQSKKCEFRNNTANDLGGALVLTQGFESYFEANDFVQNHCGINGGAMYIINTEAKFFNCDFLKNQAGQNEIRRLTASNFNLFYKTSIHFQARGGGALAFFSDGRFRGDNTTRLLYTQGCCFLSNKANNGYSFRPDGTGAGHVIMFDGYVHWQSFKDWMSGVEQNNIGYSNRMFDNPNATLIREAYYATEDSCDGVAMENYDPVTASATIYEFKKPKRSVNESTGPTRFPSPTTYIFDATPITHLPWKTTRSTKPYATTQRFKIFKRMTVHRTAPSTPCPSTVPATPEATGLTPYPTPKPSPPRTPATTPDVSPAPTPPETPENTHSPSPVRTPSRSPLTPHPTRTPKRSPTVSRSPLPSRTRRIPKPTKTPIPPRTPSETPTRSPKRTKIITPMPTKSPRKGFYYSLVETNYQSETQTVTTIHTVKTTIKETFLNGDSTLIQAETAVLKETTLNIKIMTYGQTYIEVKAELGFHTDDETGDFAIIVAAILSGFLLVLIVALFIWFFIGYSRSSSSSDSVVEMDEEHLLHVPANQQQPLTNENPLWTTSVMGDNDDPFRNDFEEVHAEGFFNDRAEVVSSDS